MKLLAALLRWLQQPLGRPEVLRKDLKPGTLFRYAYADHVSHFVGYVPPAHPDAPVVAGMYASDNVGPGDLLTAVEVLWEPPS